MSNGSLFRDRVLEHQSYCTKLNKMGENWGRGEKKRQHVQQKQQQNKQKERHVQQYHAEAEKNVF